MAWSGFTTADYFRKVVTPPVVGPPMSFAGWFNPNTLTPAASGYIVCFDNSASIANVNNMTLFVSTSGKAAIQNDGAAGGSLSSTLQYNLNAWNHAGGVYDGVNQTIYLNGAGNSINQSAIPGGLDSITVGAGWDTGPVVTRPFPGALAEIAAWNILLSAADMLALSKGLSPLRVHPEALVGYWPLRGNSPENNLKSNASSLSMVGSLTKAAHPRILMPKHKKLRAY